MTQEAGAEAAVVSGEGAEPTLPEVTETETPTPTAEESAASLTPEEGGEVPEGEEAEEKSRAQERIRQEIDKRKETERKLADLESKVAELAKDRDVIPAVDEAALNSHLGHLRDQIEELRLEGNHLKADILDRQRNKLIDEYEAWQKDAAKKNSERSESQQWEQTIKDVETTSTMYRDQMKIPAPLWDEMGQWFAGELKTNKVMEREFLDILKLRGPVSAVRFAHEQAKPVFDAKAKQAAIDKAKRDADKSKQVGGGAGGEGKGSYSSYQQLIDKGSAAVEAYKKANPDHYQKLLDKHIK